MSLDSRRTAPPEARRRYHVAYVMIRAAFSFGLVLSAATLAAQHDHWSFRPIRTPTPKAPADDGWCTNDIDRFVLARLEREDLRPAADADPIALIRRVTFDLTGLPPSPNSIAAFVAAQRSPRSSAEQRLILIAAFLLIN